MGRAVRLFEGFYFDVFEIQLFRERLIVGGHLLVRLFLLLLQGSDLGERVVQLGEF